MKCSHFNCEAFRGGGTLCSRGHAPTAVADAAVLAVD